MSAAADAPPLPSITLHVRSLFDMWMHSLHSVDKAEQYELVVSMFSPPDSIMQQKTTRMKQNIIKTWCEESGILFFPFEFNDTTNANASFPPTVDHIGELVNIAALIKSAAIQRVAVHCHAGVSRSAAAAYIILRELGYSEEATMKTIKETSPFCDPNKLMLQIYKTVKG